MKNRFVPEKVKSFSTDKGWLDISGGQHHTLALDSEGKQFTTVTNKVNYSLEKNIYLHRKSNS